MNILVCLDENYLLPLRVMLKSLFVNNPGEKVVVWLLHRAIPQAELQSLEIFCRGHGAGLCPIAVDGSLFYGAPVMRHYTQEMYYRLLAPHLLPSTLHRVLYLDPDTLIINPLRPLYQLDMQGNVFAAASHTGKTEMANNMNKIRLGTEHNYFNSGVLLINLNEGRKQMDPQAMFRFVAENTKDLLLPDQDILNSLYGAQTLEVDDSIWNYDARNYGNYILRSAGQADVDWVMQNTAILHFCGNTKPWKPLYPHRFGLLYRHYMQLATRPAASW
ncbi:glycosyltransferase family 8 protein [Clostridia bacterium OttesenSCG-928-O13]|nr:glycosyltransferase family 8 protein [Clostridia bacterium OttesenSCG-928-O13]